MQNKILEPKMCELRALCEKHQVLRLDVFGSVLTPDFGDKSDIDFLVTFVRGSNINAFHQYFEFKEALEDLLGRNVDLVCANAIRNPYFKEEVEKNSQPLYAA